jgi:hypothetical protein
MRLYNTLVIYDVYTVAESAEAANEAALALVRAQEDPLPPSEQVANEAKLAKNIRTSWCTQRPLVGADVSDEDFEQLKGKTTIEIRELIYGKEPTKEPKK